jgi:hypothetical protein
MSRRLTQEQRTYLDWVESTEEWAAFNHADMIGQVIQMLDRYAYPPVSMARFLLEIDSRLGMAVNNAQADEDGESKGSAPWKAELGLVKFEIAAMAAILTRKERGKAPLI